MGTLFSTLDIARSGLSVAQVQLDTAAHNIANATNEGFSRQRVELLTRTPISRSFGEIGRGVDAGLISRLRDPLLDTAFRDQVKALGSARVQAEFYTQIEDIFLEPTEDGIAGRISLFFDSLNEFATNVESIPVRQSVIAEAIALAQTFQDTNNQLEQLRTIANEEIRNQVPVINALGEQVAELNLRIARAEGTGNPANDLRDERDRVLDELAELANIFTRERSDGQVEVLISGDQFVTGGLTRELQAVINPALDPNRNDLVEIQFVDSGQVLTLQEGEVAGAFFMRDNEIPTVQARLNTIASTLIQEINNIHSQGNGLNDYSGTLTTTNAPVDAVTALDVAGLPFPVTSGSFDFTVYDNTGAVVGTASIPVTAGVTTLNDVVAGISAVNGNVTATVNADNTVDIAANPGFTFAFSNDSSGVLTALGANTLFTGSDARDIGVSTILQNDPSLLASGFSSDPLETGDNTAALAMADVQNGLFLDGGTSTILDFYESTIVEIGVRARVNEDNLIVEQQFVETFDRRRQQVSGVSIDEEVTFLLQFQRAFEASARAITTTDRMLESLLTMAL